MYRLSEAELRLRQKAEVVKETRQLDGVDQSNAEKKDEKMTEMENESDRNLKEEKVAKRKKIERWVREKGWAVAYPTRVWGDGQNSW